MKLSVLYRVDVACDVDTDTGEVLSVRQFDQEMEPVLDALNRQVVKLSDGWTDVDERSRSRAIDIAESVDWPAWECA